MFAIFDLKKCVWDFDGLGIHLFVKAPQPRDSEVTLSVFQVQLATCYYQSSH